MAAEAASRRGGWREATAPPAQPRVDELLRRHASALGSDESSAGSGTDTEAAAASAGGEAAACSGSEADIPLDGGSSSEAEEAELPLAAPPFAQGQRLRAVAPPPPPPPQSRAAALFRRALPGTRGSTTRLLDQRLR